MMTPATPPPVILLVEDNAADVRLFREALLKGRPRAVLRVASDGDEAMAFLRRRPPFTQAERPALIFLDLNLPRKDGREVLAEIKADPGFKSIPVVVLTTSKAEEDILASYNAHANCYLTKPAGLEPFLRTVAAAAEFWLATVTLPPSREARTHAQ